MTSIRVLDRTVPIEVVHGEGSSLALDAELLLAAASKMAALINAKASEWTPIQKMAFEQIGRIIFFDGKVVVNGFVMDRPCCDEDDAVFYWEAVEFYANTDPDVHANTFFHECWHVMQFKDRGFARDDEDAIDREVEAIDRQIEVARTLGNSAWEIEFLERYKADRDAIGDRIDEGVHGRVAPHRTGALRAWIDAMLKPFRDGGTETAP